MKTFQLQTIFCICQFAHAMMASRTHAAMPPTTQAGSHSAAVPRQTDFNFKTPKYIFTLVPIFGHKTVDNPNMCKISKLTRV